MPAVAIQILDLCQKDEPDMSEIAKLIGSDPALSAKILRLTNSPVYGLKCQVRTVSHAICLLGLSAVRPLALSFSLVKGLQARDRKALTWFWKRSLLSAVAARELAAATNYRLAEEAFLGALLQDIGVLAMRQLAGTELTWRPPVTRRLGEWPASRDRLEPGLSRRSNPSPHTPHTSRRETSGGTRLQGLP